MTCAELVMLDENLVREVVSASRRDANTDTPGDHHWGHRGRDTWQDGALLTPPEPFTHTLFHVS